MSTVPLADEVTLEASDIPDEDGLVMVSVDGVWWIDLSKQQEFAEKLAKLIGEYRE